MQTQPVEDIDSVLGRFQAWAGTQNPKKSAPAIRELSYEEALQSSRYRWPGNNRQATEQNADTKSTPRVASRRKADSVAAESVAREGKLARSRTSSKRARQPVPAPVPPTAARQEARPVFREALKEAMQPAQIVPVPPSDLARQSAISIRLAPSERELIRARAEEAGITASAYIRQCALEVEQLRAQVKDAVAAFQLGAAAVASPLSAPPAGFVSRIFRKIFPRRTPSLALRA